MVTPGRFLYNLYYRPKGRLKKVFKTGLIRSLEQERGRREMESHATALTEIRYENEPTFEVYFLTGKKYWYQTAFCLFSLQKHAGVNINAYVIDDGSIDESLSKIINHSFPSSTIVKKEYLDELLEESLPFHKFPAIRKRRLNYPHLRKLTDIHILPHKDAKLVLDSDMLFFQRPERLIQWLLHPVSLLFLRDSEESYGYSREIMEQLTRGCTIPDRLNVGVAGIQSSRVDWEKLEWWIRTLEEKEGTSYLQEQALTAMIAAGYEYELMDSEAYKVLPTIRHDVSEILHHYVSASKYDYFAKGWKLVIQ